MQETQEMRVPSLGRQDTWRRKWQPTPVLLARESHGQRSLTDCSPRSGKELDATVHRCAHVHAHTHSGSEVIEQGLKSRSPELKDKTLCSSPQAQTHLVSSTSLYLPGGLRPCIPCFFFKKSISSQTSSWTNNKILNLYGLHRYSKLIKENILCPRPLRWRKTWHEKPYGFPNVPKEQL